MDVHYKVNVASWTTYTIKSIIIVFRIYSYVLELHIYTYTNKLPLIQFN